MKGSSQFHFKQFSISQDRATHKVGTDGVLLGAWVRTENVQHILDIGTGTGLIALMLAQRTPDEVRIDAIEIESEDAVQAIENVAASPWRDRIAVHHSPIQNFSTPLKYDLVVTNPPYFVNSLLPPGKKRSAARHMHQLTFSTLLQPVSRFLGDDGRLGVIFPHQEALQFQALAKDFALHCSRQCAFRSRPGNPVERLLMEYSFSKMEPVMEELVLHAEGNTWSEEYRRITADFYLNT